MYMYRAEGTWAACGQFVVGRFVPIRRPMPEGDEGLEGLDDALGEVITRKTHAQRRTVDKHGAKLTQHAEEIERLKRMLEDRVLREDYLREATQVRMDATEGLALAREARSELAAQFPQLRNELLKTLRDELAEGLTAQYALAGSHAKALADLQGTSSDHEGRVSSLEAAMRAMEANQRERTVALEDKLAATTGEMRAELDAASRSLAEVGAAVTRAQENERAAKEEQERLAEEVKAARRREEESSLEREREMGAMLDAMIEVQGVLRDTLGVELSCNVERKKSRPVDGRESPATYFTSGAPASGGHASSAAAAAGAQSDEWSHEFGAAGGRPAAGGSAADGPADGGSRSAHKSVGGSVGGTAGLPGQLANMKGLVGELEAEVRRMTSELAGFRTSFGDERLAMEARAVCVASSPLPLPSYPAEALLTPSGPLTPRHHHHPTSHFRPHPVPPRARLRPTCARPER